MRSKKEKALGQLSELTDDDRWEAVTQTTFETIKEALREIGYTDAKIVLMLESGERQAVLGAGFTEPGEGFEFIMEMATAYAEAVGIRMIATRASGPIKEGRDG